VGNARHFGKIFIRMKNMKNIIYSRFGKAKKPGIFYGAEGAVRFGLLVAGVPGLILLLLIIFH